MHHGAPPGWVGVGAELLLGSSCRSRSAAEPGMCQTPLCQNLNKGGRSCFGGDSDRALPADGAPCSALGLRERVGVSNPANNNFLLLEGSVALPDPKKKRGWGLSFLC